MFFLCHPCALRMHARGRGDSLTMMGRWLSAMVLASIAFQRGTADGGCQKPSTSQLVLNRICGSGHLGDLSIGQKRGFMEDVLMAAPTLTLLVEQLVRRFFCACMDINHERMR